MAKEKKEKKPKPPKKEKAPKKQKEPAEPGEKKKSPLKLIIIIVAVVLVLAAVAGAAVYFFVLRDSGDDLEPNPKELSKTPAVYAVGLDEVVSLDSVMDEGAAVLTTVEAPTKAAVEAGIDEKTYRYKQAEDPADLAEDYIKVLVGEEQGFLYTDTDNRQLAEAPELGTAAGSVILAKAAASESEDEEAGPVTFRVVVAWSEQAIAIQVSHLPGAILPPPEPEVEPDESGSSVTNVSEQVEFFSNLSPSVLGLPGASMSEYRLYPLDGWVTVNDTMCRQINVYLLDLPAGTNSFYGSYFITSDLRQLFTMDSSGKITSIDMGNN